VPHRFSFGGIHRISELGVPLLWPSQIRCLRRRFEPLLRADWNVGRISALHCLLCTLCTNSQSVTLSVHSVYSIGRHEFDVFDRIVVVQTNIDLEADPVNGQDSDILD
jgi:hypothetical protein